MFKRLIQMFLFLCGLGAAMPVQALESDQYRIWRQGMDSVQDSTDSVNLFLNAQLQEFLQKKARHGGDLQNPDACLAVAHSYMGYIRPNFFKDKLKTLLLKKLASKAVPKDQRLFYDYKHSIFKGLAWPFLMPVAQTVKIDGVHLGTDKIDHFFASGRRYLNAYRRALRDGKSTQDAVIRAIKYGVSWPEETGILGLWSAGSFSFADLEANFQGFQLGRDLCEGSRPILKVDAQTKRWTQQRPIRIEDYVSPLWDESFNNSHYIASRWRKVKKNLQKEYCAVALAPEVQTLWKSYQKRLMREPYDFHLEYLRGMIIAGLVPNPSEQSLHAACEFAPGVMQGPDIWQLPSIHLQEKK